jgi:hypothetical protein
VPSILLAAYPRINTSLLDFWLNREVLESDLQKMPVLPIKSSDEIPKKALSKPYWNIA